MFCVGRVGHVCRADPLQLWAVLVVPGVVFLWWRCFGVYAGVYGRVWASIGNTLCISDILPELMPMGLGFLVDHVPAVTRKGHKKRRAPHGPAVNLLLYMLLFAAGMIRPAVLLYVV